MTNNKTRNRRKQGNKRKQPTRQRPAIVIPALVRRRKQRRRTTGQGVNNEAVSSKYDLITASINGNASGTVKIGPDNAESKGFVGLINSHQKYRVKRIRVMYVTEASSTDRGCMSYHLDTSLKMKVADLKAITSWPLSRSGVASYGANVSGDRQWYENNENQCYFLYKGNGEAYVAGHFKITVWVTVMNSVA